MLGSSSTTSSRASGVVPRAGRPGRELPDTSPPKGADAVVMAKRLGAPAAVALDATCESPGRRSAGSAAGGFRAGVRSSLVPRCDAPPGCQPALPPEASAPGSAPRSFLAAMLPRLSAAHRPAPAPVADRVVLGTAQAPPPAKAGAHGAHGAGLRAHPRAQGRQSVV